MTDFRFELDIDVRFRDLDAMGHVNNAVYATYLERGRLAYLDEVVDGHPEGTGLTIANLDIEFERPIDDEDRVTVGVRVPSIGSKSVPLEYAVRTADGVAATGQTTLVIVDRETGSPVAVPDDWRERIENFEGL